MELGPLPEVYAVKRPLHDDWPWPLSLIPRRWTGVGFPMPPVQLLGNAPERWIARQPGYPVGKGTPCQVTLPKGVDAVVWGPDPVPPTGYWTLQAVQPFRSLRLLVPCFFAFSAMVFGRRLYFGGFLKPDVTLGDWFWWFEFSLTWTKPA